MPRLHRLLTRHPLQTFLIMAAASLLFGLSTYNLFFLFKANFSFIADYGVMAFNEGAAEQLFWLCCYGLASLALYIILKACEKILVEKILH